jgi:hypothetical protein
MGKTNMGRAKADRGLVNIIADIFAPVVNAGLGKAVTSVTKSFKYLSFQAAIRALEQVELRSRNRL